MRFIKNIKRWIINNFKGSCEQHENKPDQGLELIYKEDWKNGLANWNQDDHVRDSLHRTGYKHLELDGSINMDLDYIKVPGRWAALMDKHRDKVQFIRGGKLVLRSYAENTKNPYRKNIDADQPYGDMQIFAPWLSNWGRKWSEEHKRHITDWDRTKFPLIGPGTVLEVVADVSAQVMGGVRFSIWRMSATREQDTPDRKIPAEVVCDQSYNDDSTVKETDLLEVENPILHDDNFGHRGFMKCVAGEAGDTPNGARNLLTDFGINLREGKHTLRLVHHYDGTLDFVCDGQVINHEPRPELNWGYVILSAEMCSGCKHPSDTNIAAHENTADGPHQPQDDGLSARSCIRDIDMIDEHEVTVDYVAAYRLPKPSA